MQSDQILGLFQFNNFLDFSGQNKQAIQQAKDHAISRIGVLRSLSPQAITTEISNIATLLASSTTPTSSTFSSLSSSSSSSSNTIKKLPLYVSLLTDQIIYLINYYTNELKSSIELYEKKNDKKFQEINLDSPSSSSSTLNSDTDEKEIILLKCRQLERQKKLLEQDLSLLQSKYSNYEEVLEENFLLKEKNQENEGNLKSIQVEIVKELTEERNKNKQLELKISILQNENKNLQLKNNIENSSSLSTSTELISEPSSISEDEVKQLRSKITDYELILTTLTEEKNQLFKLNVSLEEELQSNNHLKSELEAKLVEKTKKLKDAEKYEAKFIALKQLKINMEKQLEEYEELKISQRKQYEDLELEKKETQLQFNLLQKKNSEKDEEIIELKNNLTSLQLKHNQAENLLRDSQLKIKELELSNNTFLSEISTLKDENLNLSTKLAEETKEKQKIIENLLITQKKLAEKDEELERFIDLNINNAELRQMQQQNSTENGKLFNFNLGNKILSHIGRGQAQIQSQVNYETSTSPLPREPSIGIDPTSPLDYYEVEPTLSPVNSSGINSASKQGLFRNNFSFFRQNNTTESSSEYDSHSANGEIDYSYD